MIPPLFTRVSVASDRSIPSTFISLRFADDRFAPGPIRYPLISFQLSGRASGVPVISPLFTPTRDAPDKSAFSRFVRLKLEFVKSPARRPSVKSCETKTQL